MYAQVVAIRLPWLRITILVEQLRFQRRKEVDRGPGLGAEPSRSYRCSSALWETNTLIASRR
ncbi:MAG TPA: hypothetical protein G4O00_04705 [Thermoflexia bacterium]|jgi:hypothetical protein|nr:hypothetical protein [Thermoflexia bacterium]